MDEHKMKTKKSFILCAKENMSELIHNLELPKAVCKQVNKQNKEKKMQKLKTKQKTPEAKYP